MRSISVLNVGDGACSVLRERCSGDDCCGRTAIIDCGSTSKGRARSAAEALSENLDPADWSNLSELVVTHFDADHWEGLLRVVAIAPTGFGGVPPDLRIFFPNVPFGVNKRLPAAVMTFITATGPFGVQVLDLRAAWGGLTRLQLVPLAEGDSFSLAGRIHEVVWPPVRLQERTTQRLNRLVERIEEEAARLAQNNYPQLQRSLDEAYANGPHNRNPERRNRVANDLRHASKPAIPRDWARSSEFRKLRYEARTAQNDLSLVFHDPQQASLLVFGDAPPWIVQRASNHLPAGGYQVALAPHHGSQLLRPGAPYADTCISQCGQRLHRGWKKNHKHTHRNRGECIHTRVGSPSIVRYLR
jgi:hypothetical protein